MVVGDRLDGVEQTEAVRGEERLHVGAARPALGVGVRSVLAGEEPAAECAVGQHGEGGGGSDRPQPRLVRRAVHEAVVRLQRDRGRQALLLGHAQPLVDHVRVEVGQAVGTDLPGPDQRVEGRRALLHRGLVVLVVREVEIDVVGAEPAQGLLDRSRHDRRREAVEARMVAALGHDEHLVAVAPPAHPVAEHRLGGTVGVGVGGVDQGAAGVGEPVEDRAGGGLVARAAEGVGAQPQRELEGLAPEAIRRRRGHGVVPSVDMPPTPPHATDTAVRRRGTYAGRPRARRRGTHAGAGAARRRCPSRRGSRRRRRSGRSPRGGAGRAGSAAG